MCGIGGKLDFEADPPASLGESMAACMPQRGPDDEGVYSDGPVVLAFRRLSILDLSQAGAQPMASDDGLAHIVFNGEVYNYRELREDLNGYSFESGTDTEVVLAAYQEYGIDCLDHLRGMFAFAIWDTQADRLFLARDRLGQKPLFYRHVEDTFWFGSTVKTILSDSAVEAEPDLPAIREFLTYGYVPSPATGFAGISTLEPGEYMLVDRDGLRKDSYWSLSFGEQFDDPPAALAHRLRDELREATRLRMRSDVPVGLFLSGGIDSTIVAALMDSLTDRPVETYSIGFDESAYDELEHARVVADAFDTNHHEYTVTTDSTEVLPELVEEFEIPFGDPSALPTYYVAEVASDDITVALNGDAGDENFAGYDRYRYDRLAGLAGCVPGRLRERVRDIVAELPAGLQRQTPVQHGRRFLRAATGDDVERYAEFICHALDDDLRGLWQGPEPADELATIRAAFDRADGPTRLDALLQVDLGTYLPDDLLVKADRATMAHSVEGRSPFLDHELVEFAARVPAKYKRRDGDGKWLLKRAFEGEIPESILERPKQGFGVPVSEWFRGELRGFAREHLERLGARDPFDRDALQGLLDEHAAGRADHGYRLWDLVWLELWYERFIDG
ncbi:Glucosamine 6-phosphate synthetase [Halapricum desulfuricans]|uniref:Putative asparagine synthetase [glutamine-hydrolyzing] n=1 Tax=Halapricum desulfuricans TaxID=2841257 RepID=A0A897NAC7_9EURY|nr:asparagine synthase (glutamine-hydrolyzing) [Halapricum desulfuricans]QSG11360.1 Glucosamine 6-phosphate synthetase [Halapricum desulfuricans]